MKCFSLLFKCKATTEHDHVWHSTTQSANKSHSKKPPKNQDFLVEMSRESLGSRKSTNKDTSLKGLWVNYSKEEADRSTCTDQVGPRQSYSTRHTDISLVLSQIHSYVADFGGRKEKTKRKSYYQYIHHKQFIRQGGKERKGREPSGLIGLGRVARSLRLESRCPRRWRPGWRSPCGKS